MTNAAKFFNMYSKDLVSGLYTAGVGQIQSYDPIHNQADVILFPDQDLLTSVPVSIPQTSDFYIRMPYKKGDFVLLVFAHRDIDPVIYGMSHIEASKRMLSMDDAIVICGINLYNDPLPTDDTDKLVIGQKDGSAKITIGNGKISLIGQVDANGKAL